MKSVVSLTGRLDMAIVVDWDVEPQNKHTKSYNIVIESIKIRSYSKKLYQGGIAILKSTYRGSTVGFLLLQCSSGVVRHPGNLRVSVATRSCRVLIFASS